MKTQELLADLNFKKAEGKSDREHKATLAEEERAVKRGFTSIKRCTRFKLYSVQKQFMKKLCKNLKVNKK